MRSTLLLTSILILISAISDAQERPTCGSFEALKQHFIDHPEDHAKYLANRTDIDQRVASSNFQKAKVVYQIPVVVHVVYGHESVNISESQIQSQISVLNEDFRMLNSDAGNVPNDFVNLSADVEIEFCLASFDPDGQWTNGITRTSTNVQQFNQNTAVMSTPNGGKDAWDTDTYLNIWVTNLNSQILGFAYPVGTQFQGVVIDYKKFGKGAQYNLDSPYNLGRTATHEVGHYFDLLHLWADNNDCNLDDGVADTPEQLQPNFGCPSHPSVSCSNNGDMFMNFMDYVDDACMVMFSAGQKTRMRAAVEGPGSGLISEQPAPCDFTSIEETNFEQLVTVYPNPSFGKLKIEANPNIKIGAFRIFNSVGELLIQSSNKLAVKEIDLSSCSPGIHTLWLNTDKGPMLKKLVIQ